MDAIEKRARELLAAEYEKHPDNPTRQSFARQLRAGDMAGFEEEIAAIVTALTPDKTMVEMPGLGFSMPRWVLQSALDIGAYMNERHAGKWKLGPIQKRDSGSFTSPEGYVPANAVLVCATRLRRLASAASPQARKAYIKAAEDIEFTVSAARQEVP